MSILAQLRKGFIGKKIKPKQVVTKSKRLSGEALNVPPQADKSLEDYNSTYSIRHYLPLL